MYKEAETLSSEVLKAYPNDDAALANMKAAKNSLSFRSKGMAQAMPEVSLFPKPTTKCFSPVLLLFLARNYADLCVRAQTCPVASQRRFLMRCGAQYLCVISFLLRFWPCS